MESLPLALLIGFLAGFFGAIPPGPLNVNILRKTLHDRRRDAFRTALGGAAVDALICGVIGLGFGWAIEAVVSNRWVRGFLALFLVVYGLKILFWDRAREEEAVRLAAGQQRRLGRDSPARRRCLALPSPHRRPSGGREPGARGQLDPPDQLPRLPPAPPAATASGRRLRRRHRPRRLRLVRASHRASLRGLRDAPSGCVTRRPLPGSSSFSSASSSRYAR